MIREYPKMVYPKGKSPVVVQNEKEEVEVMGPKLKEEKKDK